MRPVLLTGFEPFGGDRFNPSQAVVERLQATAVAGHPIVGHTLPCRFGDALTGLLGLVRSLDPVLVVCTGLAAGAAEIRVERVALNLEDARIADNAGNQPVDRPVRGDGPAAYWSTLPVKAVVTALWARGIPAAVSLSAGTFVCNHVFYGLLDELQDRPGTRGGFIHLPLTPEQAAGRPSLPLERMVEAIRCAIETSLGIPQGASPGLHV